MDLSVAVTPLYFGSMAWERRALRRRAEVLGPSAADYLTPDTTTSLGMGVLSLTTPLTALAASYAVPFRRGTGRGRSGRIGQVVLGVALAAAVATTVADRVAATADVATEQGRRARARARKVSQVGGVAALAAGGVVLTATTGALTSATRLWRKGQRRDLGTGVVPWSIAMVWWDLAYYWNHRVMHEVRGMWAIHVPHHSSEHYNLSTALRQPVAGAFGVWVPYGLVARMGVRPSIIETSRALNLIYQYWIHTDMVRSIGPAESVLNTPSHHRVHHGRNKRYIDRNHAGILIIWDRMFGTFQREEPDEPVIYGLTKNIESYNFWTVCTHEYRDMFRDVAHSTSWRDRLGFVLRTPGWAYARRDELAAATEPVAIAG
ncbi:MAG: sterol desaturase family protein [Actinomycetota bacterium]|nr:sterol desaturase family protein [Actinomycetota bacterium]